jgi:heme exporter protein D
MTADRYAVFVWPAYAVSALGFAWMILDSLIRAGRWRRRARKLERSRKAGKDVGG